MVEEIDTRDSLYPIPSHPPSHLSPYRLAGIDHVSDLVLLKCLKDNNKRWHCFFNDKHFHNHATHHLLAIYALGAPGPLIEAAYETHVGYQQPVVKSPEPIDEHNFNKHLGDDKYYHAYLEFFNSTLLEKGIPATLQEYIFSPRANIDPAISETDVDRHPQMLNRLLAGLFHPFIHAGYGVEFGLPGQLAEGLAMTAVHDATSNVHVPFSLFATGLKNLASNAPATVIGAVSRLTSMFPSLSLGSVMSSVKTQTGVLKEDVDFFTIMTKVLSDSRFSPATLFPTRGPNFGEADYLSTVLDKCGEELRVYAEEWLPTQNVSEVVYTDEHLLKKMEEMIWMNVVIFGIGGWGQDKPFNADFLLMHLVTSAIFLPTYLAPSVLPMRSRVLLLHTYFSTSLATWVGRGRPRLSMRAFMRLTNPHVVPPGAMPEPAKDTLPPHDKLLKLTPDTWLAIVQSTLVHPDEHLCKIQRALFHYSTLYGNRPKGYWKPKGKGPDDIGEDRPTLEGIEDLDGTVFARVAGLTANSLGWMREGKEQGKWRFDGFFE
ncbi:hypothetical protein JAAARDRAFT_34719 [Jaapia argillacea MUCL 33604]|uniref:Oxidoreductase AflY n=1 Tax=Jaapia argillacea MUCL 33604 TaxID=933084 RepID=A0A067Q345_9AGAM|nr:hypothetical protein JAAARDRAFT_34719 [Jaapia argillacea MUCL 33604]